MYSFGNIIYTMMFICALLFGPTNKLQDYSKYQRSLQHIYRAKITFGCSLFKYYMKMHRWKWNLRPVVYDMIHTSWWQSLLFDYAVLISIFHPNLLPYYWLVIKVVVASLDCKQGHWISVYPLLLIISAWQNSQSLWVETPTGVWIITATLNCHQCLRAPPSNIFCEKLHLGHLVSTNKTASTDLGKLYRMLMLHEVQVFGYKRGKIRPINTLRPTFSKRHIQMHFLEWKSLNFDKHFTEDSS